MRQPIPSPGAKKKRPHSIKTIHAIEAVATGDRVAFITQGRWPRAMCGIVISASSKDRRGRRCHRVLTSGKIYLARPNAIRRLVLKRF